VTVPVEEFCVSVKTYLDLFGPLKLHPLYTFNSDTRKSISWRTKVSGDKVQFFKKKFKVIGRFCELRRKIVPPAVLEL